MKHCKNEFQKQYVELSRGDRSAPRNNNNKKVKGMAFSAAALAVFCISLAAGMAAEPKAEKAADLSAYRYTQSDPEDPMAKKVSEEDMAAGQGGGHSAPYVPEVKLPVSAPESSVKQSASVDSGRARIASPAAYDIRIEADGESNYVTASGTVEDALEKTGIELGRNDIVTPSLDTPLTDKTVITVQRVKLLRVTTSQTIPYETEYTEDEDIPLGETAVLSEGRKGKVIRKYQVKKVDGEEVSRKLISEVLDEEPVNEIIAQGTGTGITETVTEKPAVQEEIRLDDGEAVHASLIGSVSEFEVPEDLYVDSDCAPVKYKTSLHGKSCAYTAEEGALMSTGKAVEQGYVAVNPDVIPYGSKLYIVADDGEVYGYAIAGDTGGSVGRDEILVDLFMWSYDECIQWGAKNVTVYILDDENEEE